jgi:hypothetical protein
MEIVMRLSPERTQEVTQYIRTKLLPLATAEQAKCARGRLNLWLQAEPNYATKKYRLAHEDDRLWKFRKSVFPEADLAQVYFANGGHGIDWHRDAAYAMPRARILNLGRVRLQTKTRSDKLISLELHGGEVIEFDSKLLHRAVPRSDDRIGIGLWQAKIDIDDRSNWLDPL